MRRGRRYQSVIAEDYAEQTGRRVEPWPEYVLERHPDIPWLGATLDALTCEPEDARAWPLELKMAIGSGRDWKDDAPLAYQAQAQVQAACIGAPGASLAGLVGPGPLSVHDYELDEEFLAAAIPTLERFWFQHVLTKTPPPADAKPGTSAAVRRLWPRDDGTTIALGDTELLDLVAEWEEAKQVIKDAKEQADARENELRARIGDATYGALADGSLLKLATVRRKGHTVEPTTYRTLRHERPRLPRR